MGLFLYAVPPNSDDTSSPRGGWRHMMMSLGYERPSSVIVIGYVQPGRLDMGVRARRVSTLRAQMSSSSTTLTVVAAAVALVVVVVIVILAVE